MNTTVAVGVIKSVTFKEPAQKQVGGAKAGAGGAKAGAGGANAKAGAKGGGAAKVPKK
jgi:hypothetical protein